MKIALIGSGNVGSVLGGHWAKNGHQVIFGTRDPESEKLQSLVEAIAENVTIDSIANAAAAAEVIVLATPWGGTQEAVQAAGSLEGKILIDCTNPLTSDWKLAVGQNTSGGEQVAAWTKGARVVKAFNATGAGNMADPDYGSIKATLFICGDHAGAKAVVTGLGEELGFEVCDCGSLSAARYLEHLMLFWIHLAYVQGLGSNIAFKLLRR